MFVIMLVFRTVKQEEGHAHKVHCSRERSRAAWQAIEEVTGIILVLCVLFEINTLWRYHLRSICDVVCPSLWCSI
jgi:hypothetical protein